MAVDREDADRLHRKSLERASQCVVEGLVSTGKHTREPQRLAGQSRTHIHIHTIKDVETQFRGPVFRGAINSGAVDIRDILARTEIRAEQDVTLIVDFFGKCALRSRKIREPCGKPLARRLVLRTVWVEQHRAFALCGMPDNRNNNPEVVDAARIRDVPAGRQQILRMKVNRTAD